MLTPFERLWSFMIKPWVIVAYVGLIILCIFYIDQPVAYYFHDFNFRSTQPILVGITYLGTNKLYIAGLFLLALFFRYVKPHKQVEKRVWFLWLCVVIPNVICTVLKILCGRARPDLLFNEHIYGFFGLKTNSLFWSFPSGHTSTVMGLALGLCILFPYYYAAFILVGLIVVLSRVLLTYHYLSDVLAAGYLALLEVGLIYWWLRGKLNFESSRHELRHPSI